MTRDYNSSNTTRRRTPSESSSSDSRYSDNKDRRGGGRNTSRNHSSSRGGYYNNKKHKKSSILLKSSVYALGIVLSVLVVAFFTIKNNKNLSLNGLLDNQCKAVEAVKINAKIEQVINGRHEILVLTKSSKGKQEIIKIDKNCLNEVSRNSFVR